MFITIEGADGVGKTTQAKLLADKLRENANFNVLLTGEPRHDGLGAVARQALLTATPLEALHLLAAARSEHLRSVIMPHLLNKALVDRIVTGFLDGRLPTGLQAPVVVCDRYIDTTFAYQVAGKGRVVEQVFLAASRDWHMPDLTIILDADEQAIEARLRARKAAMPNWSLSSENRLSDQLDEKFASERRRIVNAFRAPLQIDGRVVRTIDVTNLDAAQTHLAVMRAFQAASDERRERAGAMLGVPPRRQGVAA
ncbi:thymidylate kinase [Rhodovarius crocodyli]|uniref:Thymidylate kinase n=1 Tax=Rhodovarius crocodyli TaxID=1979269 RepID=A0A437MF75_9PROT|nr:dTMP kinase [Rhodovarius crocodyli]RVT96280.1 thymidylate kinase [Rhodovarius crocodyli]